MADHAVQVVGVGQVRIDQLDPIARGHVDAGRFGDLVENVRSGNARREDTTQVLILEDSRLQLGTKLTVVGGGETLDRASVG